MKERNQIGWQESLEQRNQDFATLGSLKHKIDSKINKILGILYNQPIGNGQETVISIKSKNKPQLCQFDKCDNSSLVSTQLDGGNSRFNTPAHDEGLQNYFTISNQNLDHHDNKLHQQYTEDEPTMTGSIKPEQTEQKCPSQCSPVEIKLSEQGSNDDKQNKCECAPISMVTPNIKLKYCQSRSEGDTDVGFESRIIEVSEQLEEDNDEQTKSTPAEKLKDIGNLKIDLLKLNRQQDIRKRSKTTENNQNKDIQEKQNIRQNKSARLNKQIDNDKEQLTHRSLCSVRNSYIQETKNPRLIVSKQLLQEMGLLLKQIAMTTRRQSETNSKTREKLLQKIAHIKSSSKTACY